MMWDLDFQQISERHMKDKWDDDSFGDDDKFPCGEVGKAKELACM
jgi:hypothetical protein